MQNKKLYIILVVVVVVVAAAAFVGGRLLNGQAGALGFIPLGNGNGSFSIEVKMTPAPELPTTKPDVTGTFVERNDNTVTIQSVTMEGAGKGGIVLSTGSSSGGPGGPGLSTMSGNGPKVEIVVTNQTKIYRDATDMGEPPQNPQGHEAITVQQVMEPGTLDDLKEQTMVMVWGRKNGDRIIADVIAYSNPVIFKKPAP